jgi:hypothetical protein
MAQGHPRSRTLGAVLALLLVSGRGLVACIDSSDDAAAPGIEAGAAAGRDATTDTTVDGPQPISTLRDAPPGDEEKSEAGGDSPIATDGAGDAAGADAAPLDADGSLELDADADGTPFDADADGTPFDDVGPIADADADVSPLDADAAPGDAADGAVVPPPPTTRSVLESMGPDCFTCADNSGCIDKSAGLAGLCEDVGGTATGGPGAGTSRTALCLAALQCDLVSGCTLPNGDPTPCYCGTGACAAGAQPAGPCIAQEQAGLESTLDPTILGLLHAPDYTPLGGWMANAIADCLAVSCDFACFP